MLFFLLIRLCFFGRHDRICGVAADPGGVEEQSGGKEAILRGVHNQHFTPSKAVNF